MPQPSDRFGRDPVALRSPARCRFFTTVMRRQMRAGFKAVRLAHPGPPDVAEDRPLMVYSNHPAWWDPAFFIVLADRLFSARESYGPIDAVMLERYRFMRRIGIFGVTQDSPRGASEFLRTAERIVDDPRRMLWITAQGEFTDPRERPVALRSGAARLMTRRPEVVAVPLALEYPFWTEKRPEALALFGMPVTVERGESSDVLNDRLAAGLEAAMDDLSGRAVRREAGRFDRLISGTSGVGGIYGGWSRLRAVIAGRRNAPDHMEET
jgi:1-acyl-sn-glycerol-3-phosphate acyltransferase